MIGIICFNSLRYAQFVYKYTEILDKNDVSYEVVYWNREGDSVGKGDNWISYEKRVNTFQNFYKKIFAFIGFTRFMYKTIKNKQYDKLIILTTQTAIPLFPLLTRKYKNKYIYDYRDITYENICIYKTMVNRLIDCSYFTSISSMGFIKSKYLGKHEGKYVMSHNSRDLTPVKVEKIPSDKIRIVYWGQVRQPEFNKKVCDLFGNDERFSLTYHGAGFHEELLRYVNEKGYMNIKLTGAYQLPDIEKFVRETDFVLNTYENDKQQQPAMTVKFYDALKYGIPMLVTKGSYMSELVIQNNIGFVVDFENNANLEALYQWNVSNRNIFDGVKVVSTQILADDVIFRERLIEFCEQDLL